MTMTTMFNLIITDLRKSRKIRFYSQTSCTWRFQAQGKLGSCDGHPRFINKCH